jgi:hypothetical protein
VVLGELTAIGYLPGGVLTQVYLRSKMTREKPPLYKYLVSHRFLSQYTVRLFRKGCRLCSEVTISSIMRPTCCPDVNVLLAIYILI